VFYELLLGSRPFISCKGAKNVYISLMLINQIMAMALMVLAGFFLAKKKLLTGEESRIITKALFYVIIPCSLIDAFGTEFDTDKLEGMIVGFLMAALVFAIFLTGGWLMGKRGFTNGEVCSVIYSNSGNLIIPIVTGVLGTQYVIYTCAYMFIQNLLTWTHAQMKMGGESELTVKKVLTHPNILAILGGLLLFLLRLRLPGPLGSAVGSLGACIGPLFMMVTGILLAEADLKAAFSSRRTYYVVFIRLILYPALVLALVLTAGRLWNHPMKEGVLMVILLCSSGPPASTLAQLAQMYGSSEARYISALTALCTVLSAVTMPVMCILYQMMI